MNIREIIDGIESLRKDREINNEAARLASFTLDNLASHSSKPSDDAILANRIVVQGADPLSLMLASGCYREFEAEIRKAHVQGPGSLTGKAKDVWLFLASFSADEATQNRDSVVDRVVNFCDSVHTIQSVYNNAGNHYDAADCFDSRVATTLAKINSLPFEVGIYYGCTMRQYSSDLGFAAAYWAGELCATVKASGNPTFVGCIESTTLAALGIKVDKLLSPTFGLIF